MPPPRSIECKQSQPAAVPPATECKQSEPAAVPPATEPKQSEPAAEPLATEPKQSEPAAVPLPMELEQSKPAAVPPPTEPKQSACELAAAEPEEKTAGMPNAKPTVAEVKAANRRRELAKARAGIALLMSAKDMDDCRPPRGRLDFGYSQLILSYD